ncbi:MAG: hypothetical protein ACUVTG_09730 [Candidatus Oleimicrobiaceae bacterium]
MPVVTYQAQGGNYRVLVCVSGISGNNTGIPYQYSDSPNEGSSWYPSAYYYLPSTNPTHKNPSLSMGPNSPAGTVYLTYDDGSSVHMNSYSTGWASPEDVSSGSGCTESKYASVELDGYFGKDVAWEAKKSSNSKYVIVHKRRTTSWEPVTYFEPSSSATRYRRPSITGHLGKARSIVWHDEGGMLYRASTVNGLSWSVVVVGDTWLQHPNLSAGRVDLAKYVFTGGSASPYVVHLSGETLPPSGGLGKGLLASGEGEDGVRTLSCAQRYHRAAIVAHTRGSGLLWVQWGEVVAKTDKGERIPLPFATWQGDLSELNQETAFGYLATEPLLLPYDVDTLAWEYELYGCGLKELVARRTSNVTVEVELVDANSGLPLAVVHRTPLSAGTAESRVAGRVAAEASGYRGLEVFPRMSLRG